MSLQTPGVKLGVLLLGLFILLLPGALLLPPIDRDEARFMQASKQMVETGDVAHINFQAEPRDKKPVGAYWAQAAMVKLFAGGDLTQTWPYRLPSMLGLLLAAALTAYAARNAAAAVILATTLLAFAEAHLAKSDALLLGASAVVFAGCLRAYEEEPVPSFLKYGVWIALGLGVLVKGPILPGLLALKLLTLWFTDRSLAWTKNLNPAAGAIITLAVVSIWPLVSGWDEILRFSQAAMTRDLLPKLTAGAESHGAPPGMHALLAVATLWPWSLLVPASAIWAWRARGEPTARFCLVWIVPFWLALELAPTKLPHYVLPLFPAIAVLIASGAAKEWKLPRVAALGFAGLILTVSAALFAPVFFKRLPTFQQLIVSDRLASALFSIRDPHQPLILVGYHEPSAVFLLGTDTILTNAHHAASMMAENPSAVLVIEKSEIDAFDRFFAGREEKLARAAEISGYNYSRGAAVTLEIFTARGSSGP